MKPLQVVIVHKKSEQKREQASQLQRKVMDTKLINTLVKEINFNSTLNRFEYLEQLLRKQHETFVSSINGTINQQKDVGKQMKNLLKQIKQVKSPQINMNKIASQAGQLAKLKKQSDKNLKLTQGMLLALSKIQKQIEAFAENRKQDIIM